VLPPLALVGRLEHAFDIVASDVAGLPERHRGLRRVVDWSYELLDEPARRAYVRAGIFAGSFDLDALAAVSDADDLPHLLDLVDTLVEANLLRQADLEAPEARFRMLETIREHALECAAQDADAVQLRQRHAAYYAELAEQAEPRLTGPEGQAWLARLERERDNIRAALRWAIDAAPSDLALRLVGALHRFWFIRADFIEGERWFTAALQFQTDAPRLRAKALMGAGTMSARLGRHLAARQYYEECLALFRIADDRAGIANALNSLGNITYDLGEHTAAGELYRDSLAMWREVGERRGISVALNNLGNVALLQGDYSAAAAAYEESVQLRRELGDRHGVATTVNNFADLELRRGNPSRARVLASEALSLCHSLGDRLGTAYAALILADEAVQAGHVERGVRLLAGVDHVCELLGATRAADEQARFQRVLGSVAGRLADAEFEACWAAGTALSPGELVREALTADDAPSSRAAPEPPRLPDSGLTEREREVLILVGRGLSNRQIAGALMISESTAAVHVKHILHKLGCTSRAQAAVWAVQHGLAA
jgi:non-specific serine/threonine protein kinase